jgi:hypothetical protein
MTEKSFDIFKLKFYTKFPDSLFTFENIENSNSEYILVNNIYGINKCRKSHLLGGVIPTIVTAVDKNLYFINKMIAVHNNKYDYSLLKYKTLLDKVKIICKNHGLFEQTAGAHSMGQGCPKCGDKICSDHHSSNPTGWSKTNWKDAAKKSKRFESFKIYIIKCWNDQETFYKIGRTFVDIKRRFQSKTEMPYNHTILKIIEGDSNDIYDLEIKLKNMNKDNKYTPLLKFNGSKECFNNVIQIW